MDHAGFHWEVVMEIKVVAAILDILKVGLVNVIVINIFYQAKSFNELFCSDQTGLTNVLGRFRW